MSTLSKLLPAGGAGKVMDFVAYGNLPNGAPVILKADGTVEVISNSSPTGIPAGAETVFNANTAAYISVAFDPNTAGKFVVAYRDKSNSYHGTAVIGTVSGTAISFGAEYVFNSGTSNDISVVFDPNTAGQFVVVYSDLSNSNYGTAIVGTVSGTTISYSAKYVFNSGTTVYISISFDPNTTGKFVVAYRDQSNSSYGTAVIGTLSGTTLSFGAEYVFNSGTSNEISVAFDPNTAGKFVVVYQDAVGYAFEGTAIVGTVSGSSISFGSNYSFVSNGVTSFPCLAFDLNTAGKFVVAYQDSPNSYYGTAKVGTVSGTTLSFGQNAIFNSGVTEYISVAFDPNTAGSFVVAYQDDSNSEYGKAIIAQVSGTTISFLGVNVLNSSRTDLISISFDPNTTGKFVVAYKDWGLGGYYDTGHGVAVVGQLATTFPTNLTASNFVGITSKAISNTATGPITLQGGVSTNQSSLTVGSTYYIQADGTVSTVSTSPAVNIGKALNATTLKLKGLSV